jgi:hypothetical protein
MVQEPKLIRSLSVLAFRIESLQWIDCFVNQKSARTCPKASVYADQIRALLFLPSEMRSDCNESSAKMVQAALCGTGPVKMVFALVQSVVGVRLYCALIICPLMAACTRAFAEISRFADENVKKARG